MAQFANGERVRIGQLPEHIGQTVCIAGWLDTKRDHGQVAFLDVRDASGRIQSVTTSNQDFFEQAQAAKEQSCVLAYGTIVERPERMRTNEPNGSIELQLTGFSVITEAKDFPWGSQSSDEVNEELRMRYRYLDLRSDRMQRNLRLRSQVTNFFRQYLIEHGFMEVETPYVTKGTPEGAREFIIPSRQHPSNFYALPQSPQQFKQLLMVAGIERYFQIARCFRDEDPRGDRQPEFTQLDMEMSFVTQEDVLQLTEDMIIQLVKNVTPDKKITQVPFPRISYAEAIAKYGSDKPDLRENKDDPNELAFAWIVDYPLFEKTEEGKLDAVHHLFTRPKPGEEHLLDTEPEKALSASYDIILNGYELSSGSIRIHEHELQKKIFRILGITEAEAQAKFGHMLDAFQYGAPPHGGIAPGIDRLVMLLAGEPNIREVIAFPKTGDGRDLMMEAPAPITDAQLKELHIRVHDAERPAQ